MASEIDLEEHTISSEVIASGGMLTVKRDQVRLPNGHQSQREYVIHPGAVVIIPILPNGHLVFERQFRYPLHQTFIELPAGKIDPQEDVLVTGQRELLEETGYTATQWVKLGIQHPCIGYSNEVIHMFLANNLTAGAHQRDVDETLDVFELSLPEALGMVQKGEITDNKTVVALFFAEQYLRSHTIATDVS